MNFLLFFVFSLDINIKALFSLKLETFFRNKKCYQTMRNKMSPIYHYYQMYSFYLDICRFVTLNFVIQRIQLTITIWFLQIVLNSLIIKLKCNNFLISKKWTFILDILLYFYCDLICLLICWFVNGVFYFNETIANHWSTSKSLHLKGASTPCDLYFLWQ